MTTNARTPVYIHSLFRAGSTYLFNVFRRSAEGYWCYQEPLNEFLLYAATDPDRLLEIHQEKSSTLRHGKLEKPYFYEFHTLADQVGRLFRKEFSYDQYFLGDNDDISKLRAYFTALIYGAQGRPMFQCCRSVGRMAQMKRKFKLGTHIFLWRNPWDQWWSYKVDSYFDRSNLLIANSKSVPDFIRKLTDEFAVPPFSSGNIWEEIEYFTKYRLDSQGSYRLFYALWCHAMLEALPYCDIVVNIDQLSESEDYCAKITNTLMELNIKGLDFSDCQIPMAAYGEEDEDFFQKTEEQIHRLLALHGYTKTDIERILQLRAENRPQLQKESGVSKEIIRDAMRARSLARQYESELNWAYTDAAATLRVSENRSQQAEAKAQQAEAALNAILNSTSWRLTEPLRNIVCSAKHVQGFPKTLNAKGKNKVKLLLVHTKLFLNRRPKLRRVAFAVLAPFPSLERRLRQVTMAPFYSQMEKPPVATELFNLTPRARQIYLDLKTAIAQKRREND